MNKIRIALHNLGCKVNSYELDNIRRDILSRGWEIVSFQDIADVYVINTCTVTNIADRKSRQMIHRARALNPKAVVAALGCYVDRDRPLDPAIDLAVGNSEKKNFVSVLSSYLGLKEPFLSEENTADYTPGEGTALSLPDGHTRAFLKIQDGCNQFCSYCIIPYVRGRIKSRNPSDIIAEARKLAENGYKELVLTGIHISSYGKDLHNPPQGSIFCWDRLLDLIFSISQIPQIERIRLGSLEPRIITEEFVRTLSSMPKVCPHFHLSLQSGSDSVLKRMNRHYTSGEFLEKTDILRKYYNNPAITTDIIVGFPGETKEDFADTVAFVEKAALFMVHIFKYSKRDGTPAAVMPDQIPEKEKTRRASLLRKEVEKCHLAYLKAHYGKTLNVLFEEPCFKDGVGYMSGHSMEYIRVMHKTDEDLTNCILHVTADICNISPEVV